MRYWLSFIILYSIHLSLWAADTPYGPVDKGETLWEIAGEAHDDEKVSRYSVVLALLYENPNSFTVSCNFNSLKLGSTLYIPKADLITKLDVNEAVKEVKRQEKAWRANRRGDKIQCETTPLQDAWQQIKNITLNNPSVLQTLNQLRPDNNDKPAAKTSVDPNSAPPKTTEKNGIPAPLPVDPIVPQALPDNKDTLGGAFPVSNNAHVLANLQWGVHLNSILISLNLGLTLFLGLLIWRSLAQHVTRLDNLQAHVAEKNSDHVMPSEPLHRLVWLFWLFFRLGFSVFGGFMALVHKIQQQVGERHRLLSDKTLIDGITLVSFLPGSMAINLSAYIGFRLRGGLGALVCSMALLLPSLFLIILFSYMYFEWGQLPLAKEAFIGLIPAITAIIFHATWVLSYKAVQDPPTTLLAVAAAVILVIFKGFYSSFIIILLAALTGILLFKSHITPVRIEVDKLAGENDEETVLPTLNFVTRLAMLLFLLAIPVLFLFSATEFGQQHHILSLTGHFLGFSLLSFGGGFGLLPMAQDTLVSAYQWLSQTEFATAVAMGQLLPEMLLSGALMAYKVGGILGAILAALALSLPTVFLTMLSSQAFTYLKKAPLAQAALLGIRAAMIGMIFATGLLIGQTAVLHWGSLLIFAFAMFMLFHWHIEAAWVVLFAVVMGMIFYSLPNLPWLASFI